MQPLYAGVVSLCEDTQFTLTFHREDTMAAAKGKDYHRTHTRTHTEKK